ncbi:MAG: histone deacetylase family protein [Candidatus Hodarchaeales archaeon]|jgi:acetoin utilization deacetylase AcuC-like enzyme
MKLIYNDDHYLHEPGLEFNSGQLVEIPEIPERIVDVYAALRRISSNNIEFIDKQEFHDSWILDVHSPDYYQFLQTPQEELIVNIPFLFPKPGFDRYGSNDPIINLGRYFFDTGTPLWEQSFPAIRSAVDCALTGAELVNKGENSYALIRPPGHHAATSYGGGYCYLNNAAIAANYLSKKGKVSVLDIDFHHGNGTQEIFYSTSRVQYVSLHGSPKWAFPYYSGYRDEIGKGEGKGYNLNLPLRKDIKIKEYLIVLDRACKTITNYEADFLVLSAGFDIILGDPTGFFIIKPKNFDQIGKKIAGLELPTLIIQEGGYDVSNNIICVKHLINAFDDSRKQKKKEAAGEME